MVENFSRWCEIVSVPDTTAETTAIAIYQHLFCRFGMPNSIITDRNRSFVNALLDALCKMLGVKHTLISPRHPRANGLCERQNQVIKNHLKKVIDPNQVDWDMKLPSVALAMRAFPNGSSEFSPSYLMFGRAINLPFDTTLQSANTVDDPNIRGSLDIFLNNFTMCREIASQNIKDAALRNQEIANTKNVDRSYKISDLVWVYDDSTPAVGLDTRLRPCFKGPYEVVDRKDANYKLKHCVSSTLTPYIHASRLKRAKLPDSDQIRSIPNVIYGDPKDIFNRGSQAQAKNVKAPRVPTDQSGPRSATEQAQMPDTSDPDKQTDRRTVIVKGPEKVSRIVGLRQRNRQRYFQVLLENAQYPFWISEAQAEKRGLKIPMRLIKEALRHHTWSGTPRKRQWNRRNQTDT